MYKKITTPDLSTYDIYAVWGMYERERQYANEFRAELSDLRDVLDMAIHALKKFSLKDAENIAYELSEINEQYYPQEEQEYCTRDENPDDIYERHIDMQREVML